MLGGSVSRALGVSCAFGLFWACGSDDKPAPRPAGKGGEGGEAGESAGKGGGGSSGKGSGGSSGRGGSSAGGQGGEGGETAGKGGSSGVGGSAGTTVRAGEGGEGGEGGAPPVGGSACTACAAADCTSELARCEASPLCSTWLACMNGCETSDCAEACDADADADRAVLLTTAVYQCMCAADCADECGTFDVCDKACVEGPGPVSSSSIGAAPALLTDTGLYTRATSNDPWTLAPYVQSFRPEYELWSDGAVKERFIYLPRCEAIDTTDMDHWSFPVGTRIWKQFTRDDVRVETRLLWRTGTGVSDWVMATYQWPVPVGNEPPDPELATLVGEAGVPDANGTLHDIPGTGACTNCHAKLSERVLGFSAIQLSHGLFGLTFSELAGRGMLSNAPTLAGYDPPGDPTAQAALGYLHANCGNCHNETGQFTGNTPATESMWLRLLVGHTTVEATHFSSTAINKMTSNPSFPMDRIEPMQPSQSSIVVRMQRDPSMGETMQMPPVGRELPDMNGIATVMAWVNSL